MSQRLPPINGAHMLGTLVDYRVRALAAAVASFTLTTDLTGEPSPRGNP